MTDDERPTPAARILYTVPNVTTGEDWATIETVNGNLAAPIAHLGVPAAKAPTVVALINDAHRHLGVAIEKLCENDAGWRDHISRVALATDKLQRLGRPRVSKEQMVRYRQKHGTDAAVRKYNVAAGTFDRYERELERQRG
jgi:hypothetical protein